MMYLSLSLYIPFYNHIENIWKVGSVTQLEYASQWEASESFTLCFFTSLRSLVLPDAHFSLVLARLYIQRNSNVNCFYFFYLYSKNTCVVCYVNLFGWVMQYYDSNLIASELSTQKEFPDVRSGGGPGQSIC